MDKRITKEEFDRLTHEVVDELMNDPNANGNTSFMLAIGKLKDKLFGEEDTIIIEKENI